MTTASSTDWRVSIRHVNRNRIGNILSSLLCRAFSCQPSFMVSPDPNVEFEPTAMYYAVTLHTGWAVPDRFPRRVRLLADPNIQGGELIRWRVVNDDGAEIGQIQWNPDREHFDSSVYPGIDTGRPARVQDIAQRAARRDPRRAEEARCHAWLQEDERAGNLFGVPTIAVCQMALDRSLPQGQVVRIGRGYVTELLHAWTHFPFLSRDIRYQALCYVGLTAGPQGLASLVRLRELYRAHPRISLYALESWCIERGRFLRVAEAEDADSPDQRQAATIAMLRMATQGVITDALLTEGLRRLMIDRDHQALVDREMRRRSIDPALARLPRSPGTSRVTQNPCAEVPLGRTERCADLRGWSDLTRLLIDDMTADEQQRILLEAYIEHNGEDVDREGWIQAVRRLMGGEETTQMVDFDAIRQRGDPIVIAPEERMRRLAEERRMEEALTSPGIPPDQLRAIRVEEAAGRRDTRVRDRARQRTLVKTLGTTARQIEDVDSKANGMTGEDLLCANVCVAVQALLENLRPSVPLAAGLSVRVESLVINKTELDVDVVDTVTGKVYMKIRVDRPALQHPPVVSTGERALDL